MTRRVAIFPWGEVIETFLDPLGLEAADFAGRMRGGWLFGFARALETCGVASVIVYASEQVGEPTRMIHHETGVPIWLVPGRRTGDGLTRGSPSLQALQQWRRTPLASFTRVLRQEGAEALLVQDYEHPRFDALLALGTALGLPVFASFQGGDATASVLEGVVRRRSLGACRGVVAPSSRERARLRARYGLPGERLFDIPNPVDSTVWRPDGKAGAREILGIPPAEHLVVTHGRTDIWRKGLDVLLSAWAQVAAAAPAARLVIIGSGQDHDRFSKLASGVPRLTWIDTYLTDPPLLRRWLSAADLYVSLSRVEGLPVAPLEALACGLPLVVSDAHGLADILEKDPEVGTCVPKGDPDAAALAMIELLARPHARSRAASAARAAAERRYSLQSVGAGLSQMLGCPEARARSRRTRMDPGRPAGDDALRGRRLEV